MNSSLLIVILVIAVVALAAIASGMGMRSRLTAKNNYGEQLPSCRTVPAALDYNAEVKGPGMRV